MHSANPKRLKISIPLKNIQLPNNSQNRGVNNACGSETCVKEEPKCSTPKKPFASDDIIRSRYEEKKPGCLKISIPKNLVTLSKSNCLNKNEEQVFLSVASKISNDFESSQSSQVEEHSELKVSILKCLIALKCEKLSRKCDNCLSSNIIEA